MSNRTTKPALVMPMTDADPIGTEEHYPRQLVVSGVLAFCLTVWAIVIFAVAHYA
jgi:hypothetical protein